MTGRTGNTRCGNIFRNCSEECWRGSEIGIWIHPRGICNYLKIEELQCTGFTCEKTGFVWEGDAPMYFVRADASHKRLSEEESAKGFARHNLRIPPSWAELAVCPRRRTLRGNRKSWQGGMLLKLASTMPTPIERWAIPGVRGLVRIRRVRGGRVGTGLWR